MTKRMLSRKAEVFVGLFALFIGYGWAKLKETGIVASSQDRMIDGFITFFVCLLFGLIGISWIIREEVLQGGRLYQGKRAKMLGFFMVICSWSIAFLALFNLLFRP